MDQKVIFEDVTMAYNKWVQGIASREQNAGKVTLFDLFDRYDKQFPNLSKERNYIPPTLSTVTTYLGNISVNNANFSDKLKQTYNLPFCRESQAKREIVKRLFKQASQIDEIIKNITKDLDKLVEKEEKNDKIDK